MPGVSDRSVLQPTSGGSANLSNKASRHKRTFHATKTPAFLCWFRGSKVVAKRKDGLTEQQAVKLLDTQVEVIARGVSRNL